MEGKAWNCKWNCECLTFAAIHSKILCRVDAEWDVIDREAQKLLKVIAQTSEISIGQDGRV